MEKYEDLVVNIIQLNGDAYEAGIQQSNEQLVSAHFAQQELFLALTANCNAQQAEAILQHVCPNLLHEMKGLAFGLQQPLETIVQMYSGYMIGFIFTFWSIAKLSSIAEATFFIHIFLDLQVTLTITIV